MSIISPYYDAPSWPNCCLKETDADQRLAYNYDGCNTALPDDASMKWKGRKLIIHVTQRPVPPDEREQAVDELADLVALRHLKEITTAVANATPKPERGDVP